MEEHQQKLIPRFNEIDLLRFLAAMAVLLFHYTFRGYAADDLNPVAYPLLGSVFKYGYLGVELFFMISGYVVLMSSYNKTLRQFFVSRFVRLYPAFWAACTIDYVFTYLLGPPSGTIFWKGTFKASIKLFLANMTMLQHFLGVPDIDGVYWTLTYELVFYAIIAVLLVTRLISWLPLLLTLAIGYLLFASFLLYWVPSRAIHLPSYVSFFMAGMVLYLIQKKRGNLWLLYGLLTALLVLSVQDVSRHAAFLTIYYKTPFLNSVVGGIVCLFYIILLLIVQRKLVLAHRNWISLAGAITYPLYLVHQNLGYILFQQLSGLLNDAVLLLTIVCAMLLLAFLIHVLVERKYSTRLAGLLQSGFDRLDARRTAS
jgi:peptidoglycan/LPS O-acetylase OafA/YrhL